MDRATRHANTAIIVLAVFAVFGALYVLKPLLVPLVLALLLAMVLSPVTKLMRRVLPLSATGAAVVLFLIAVMMGLYAASLTAESIVEASVQLPQDIDNLSRMVSNRINESIRDKPYLKAILPDPRTIDQVGETNRKLLLNRMGSWLVELSGLVLNGLIVMILVLFLLAEIETLTPKAVRFFSDSPTDSTASEGMLRGLTHQIRAFLLARTIINIGFGLAVAVYLRIMGVNYAFVIGVVAGLTNFVPYVGQVIGGALPTFVTLAQYNSLGDALIVAAIYLGIVGIEGYVITPWVMGKSLDLNGTTVLVACMFWGFLWGLIGLMLAMPITVCMKLVFQAIPEMHRWAELMSVDWRPPPPTAQDLASQPPPTPDGPLPDHAPNH